MNFIPGWFPSGAVSARQNLAPAIRLNGSDERMHRTSGANSADRTRITFSAWVKRAATGAAHPIYTVDNGANGGFFGITSTDLLTYFEDDGIGPVNCNAQGSTSIGSGTWVHVVLQVNTNEATAANRVRMWVNGAAESVNYISGATPGLSAGQTFGLNTLVHNFGHDLNTGSYFNGDVGLFYYVDGQIMAPTDFADTIEGVYQAKRPTPTYSNNGCFLYFDDPADLGNDDDNGKDHTLVNIDSSNAITDGPPASF